MWTSVICSSFAWHLPVPVRHHTTPLEGGIHPISSGLELPAQMRRHLTGFDITASGATMSLHE
jgi:hypothetical protein